MTVVAVAAVPSGLPVAQLRMLLPGAAVAGGLVLVVQGALLWRGSGRAAPLWLSAAALAHVVWTADLAGLEDLLAGSDATLPWLAPAASMVVWAALAAAALWPTVDARLRPWMVLLGAGVAIVLMAGLVAVTFDGLRVLSGEAEEGPPVAVGLWPLLPAAWAVAAVTLGVQGHRRRDPVLGWATLLALAVGGSEALRHGVQAPQTLLASELAHTAAVLTVAGGLAASVAGLASGHRRQLGTVADSSRAVEQQLRSVEHARSELRHEAQNALTAADAGVTTLQAGDARLSADDRAALIDSIRSTIERVQWLFNEPEEEGTLRSVDVAAALQPVVTGARAQGQAVHVDLPAGVCVWSTTQGLAQVVSILLDNAAKHAGSPVELRATTRSDGVVLRCEDRGPGIPEPERARIFRRGEHGTAPDSHGRGLGLAVAAQIVHAHGGRIWVEERPGGGAAFVVWLASPPGDELQPSGTDRAR